MCTERYHFVAFGCMKIPNFVRDGRKFPFRADGREKNEGGSGLGGKKGAWYSPFLSRQKNNHDGVRHPGTNAVNCLSPHANRPSVALALFAG